MSKSYSNKALPAGTVLREWRLEEVLGVGGFGIVYKGRGIYFDELVAIKEYFPSAISERRDGDTVVPIDSNAEEVHALGLKKFVEEAKLLWNLSTPTRHPNIVSVRSLFEIHGTAYIVMDFEDGVSLSKLLKDGRRFNEASLTNWVVPIAEGLERAHRVGVLHRDIKPPNILINVDGRPVLIDFGSARFESADATSTTVTFHTPPYAAIEQYVKTYDQGPWTDIYALGVVLYECVTGEKPPEVLERLHGGLGTPLVGGNWPGYSSRFLEAVDAAMTIRPGDRPQSIAKWLAMFDETKAAPPAAPASVELDEDATRIYIAPTTPDVIVPVAPVPEGFAEPGKIETAVPEDTSEVKFKLAGRETGHSVKQAPAALNLAPKAPDKADTAVGKPAGKTGKGSNRPALIAATGLGVLLVAGGGWYLTNTSAAPDAGVADTQTAEAVPVASGSVAPVQVANADELALTIQALAADARRAGVSAKAVTGIAGTAQQIAALRDGLAGVGSDAERAARTQDMSRLAVTGVSAFAAALAGDAAARNYRLGREALWTDPRNAGAAQAARPDQRRAVRDLRAALAGLNAAAGQAQQAADAGTAIAAARQALSASNSFSQAYARAARLNSAKAPQLAQSGGAATIEAEQVAAQEPAGKTADSRSGVSPGKQQQFNASVGAARSIAENVIRQSRSTRTTDTEKKRALEANVKAARTYLSYLDNLANSMRGAKSDSEAERMIGQAEQTRRYLMVLLSRST